MSRQIASRRELLNRWGRFEEEEQGNDDCDPSISRRLNHRKEEWFADAFNFLISLPKETHIWCGHGDIMGPLLETFYNYDKDERSDSPLKLLWKRISEEMRHCIQCISQHHQAQVMYDKEYEFSSVGLLLEVLRKLDEERVTLHLKEINAKFAREQYDPQHDYAEVVNVMYEVLMFPILFDDQSLCAEFEKFIESVANMHELALAGNQHFPGVFALLFLNRRVRTIGYRLARAMGKLRRGTDLDPFQPLLKKFIGILELEGLPSGSQDSRARVHLDRSSIWLGITSLLEFLEPPAFEDGILEPYPIFMDTVLNHISGDSLEFSHAVSCLKELFKMLGFKLWLRSTLSPSVMRNTLLGQCFHTRNEKVHKAIFDLFHPFLESLEALQDGEHERQRRHYLYFLLHQVPVSSNFSLLARRIGCKIALLIVLRGYQMNPPCPAFECAHMWGPSLVSTLKDSSLHSSLRQPAFDLIQAIVVSDATALITSVLHSNLPDGIDRSMYTETNDDEGNTFSFSPNAEEKDSSSWSEFTVQSKITMGECAGWMCVPMLWIEILVDIDPLILPVSFCKAVFWARSRFCLVEPENNIEMTLDTKSWLSSSAIEITPALGWKLPTGSDDGGGGQESKNSMRVSTMCLSLIRTYKRLTTHFLLRMGQEVRKQWTWEPRMGESLILSLLDPNDNMRQLGKTMLEQVSNTRGLACGLKFLCSESSNLSAVFAGVKHALDQVQLDSVLLNFQNLHHFFFLLCKLLKEEDMPKPYQVENVFEGGFLRQPVFDTLPINVLKSSSNVGPELLEKFCCALSEVAWGPVKWCLVEGKAFVDQSLCQMTCVRLLEVLPLLLGRLKPLLLKRSWSSSTSINDISDFKWLHDLIDWGRSELKVVVVYWKRALTGLLNLLKGFCAIASASAIRAIENLITSDQLDMDRLTEQVSRLCVSLSKEVSKNVMEASKPIEEKHASTCSQLPSRKDKDVQILESVATILRTSNTVIDLSEGETKNEGLEKVASLPRTESHQPNVNTVLPANRSTSQVDSINKNTTSRDALKSLLAVSQKRDAVSSSSVFEDSDTLRAKQSDPNESGRVDYMSKEPKSGKDVGDAVASECRAKPKNATNESVACGTALQVRNSTTSTKKDTILTELVCEAEVDPLESALKSARTHRLSLAKPGLLVPKRQVIQLKSPFEKKSDLLQRPGSGLKRFKPPRLEDWYRQILQLDYFATVGLAPRSKDENQNVGKFKEVPVCFESHEQYMKIFRPLVLEEFKAQLQSSFQELSSLEEMYCSSLSVLSVERVDDFHHVRFVQEDNDTSNSRSLFENDLVLLTKGPLTNSTHDVHMIGKVERRERDEKRRSSILLVRFYLQNGSSRLHQARRTLLERSKWHASHVLNMTPQMREFQALSSIKDIPILPVILNPVHDLVHSNDVRKTDLHKLSQSLQQKLRSSFNESQLQAITVAIGSSTSMKDFEMSLIQGPPGTGKTRTIVAIVSGLLATLPHKTADSGNSAKDLSFSTAARQKLSQSVAMARAWQDAAMARQLQNDVERDKKSIESSSKGRVLICAQSNAAVDELVSRISSAGIYGRDGKMYKPYLVRVGNAKTVHPNSLPFFIDRLVDQRLAEERMKLNDAKNNTGSDSSAALRSNLEKLVDRIRFYEAKRANMEEGSELKDLLEDGSHKGDGAKELSDAELGAKLRRLYEQKRQIYKDLGAVQAQERKANEEIRALRHKLRKSILREAQIVVTTLSGCGGDLYAVCAESITAYKFGNPSEHTLFDAVVIDEAAQALEPATLIPLQLLKSRGTKCIMVGDPKQLPATVVSNIASKFLYECSMFERLQRAGYPVHLLTQQYRMHPEICRFPSVHFYDSKLLNGENMSSKSAPFHDSHYLGPYVFYDIVDGQELRRGNSGSMSLCNEQEADAAVQLLRFFKKRYPSEFVAGRIGIITPYKRQLLVLRSRFLNAFGSSVVADMELNTVDGFQGREVDILVLSTVRASDSGSSTGKKLSSSIGFVADVRRMNVALTRARLSLWILGNAMTLQRDSNWALLLKDAKERNLVISNRRPYGSMFDGKIRDQEHSESHSKNKTQHCYRQIESANSKSAMNSDGKRCYLSTKGQDNQNSRSEARDDCSQIGDDHASVAADSENRTSKGAEYLVAEEHVRGPKRKHKGKGKERRDENLNVESSRMHKKKHTEPNYSHGNSDSNLRKESKFSSEVDRRNKRDSEASVCLSEGKHEAEKGKKDGSFDQVGAFDTLSKRRRQRETVDAILFSSLIPSRKSMPPKRPVAPDSATSGGTRPPKARKGSTSIPKP